MDGLTRPTLDKVIAIVAHHSGVPAARLHANSAIDQDLKITGDDVTELAVALAKEFDEHVLKWPWQRFAKLSQPSVLTGFWLIWRLLTWPIRGRLFDPSLLERLELGHVASVIDRGGWFDP